MFYHICAHMCAHTCATRTALKNTRSSEKVTILFNTQSAPPAVTAEEGQRKPGPAPPEEKNFSQDTATCLPTPRSTWPEDGCFLLAQVPPVGIVRGQSPRCLFLHAPMATSTFPPLLHSQGPFPFHGKTAKAGALFRAASPFPKLQEEE